MNDLIEKFAQFLVLTLMAMATIDEIEVRILYEYLAEASVVFPKVNNNILIN